MDFAAEILECCREWFDELERRIEEALKPFAANLQRFLDQIFSHPLPDDWRDRWHAFVAEQAALGFFVEEKSIVEMEAWIGEEARRRGLIKSAVRITKLSQHESATDTHNATAAGTRELPESSPRLRASGENQAPDRTDPSTFPRTDDGRVLYPKSYERLFSLGGTPNNFGGYFDDGKSTEGDPDAAFDAGMAILGTFVDVIDLINTGIEIRKAPKDPWSYIGAIPFIPATAGKVGKAARKAARAANAVDNVADAARAVGNAAEAASSNLSSGQASSLAKFIKKLPSAAEEAVVHNLPGGGKAFVSNVPGRVPGSYAQYLKQVGPDGKTILYYKTTFDPLGGIVHVKDKLDDFTWIWEMLLQ